MRCHISKDWLVPQSLSITRNAGAYGLSELAQQNYEKCRWCFNGWKRVKQTVKMRPMLDAESWQSALHSSEKSTIQIHLWLFLPFLPNEGDMCRLGFLTKIPNLVITIPDAQLYHFGVLTSNVHMAWMRAVCGRLKSDYRYSKDVVYNNFPWPTPTDAQQDKIEQTAQAILDARALYPDCSLADLYDEVAMPPELRKAHQQNDRAVMQAYGFDVATTTETSCVAELMRMYQALVE